MRKKMYWGLASLILIVGVVGVFVMLQPDPEPEKRYKLPSEAENKQKKDVNQPQRPVSEVVKPPPPGASPNGHWHGDEWHDEPHQTPIAEVSQKTPAENLKTEEKTDLSKYYGKSGEDFYRDRFSREELESMIKVEQREVERLKTKHIPELEKLREKQLKFLQSIPDSINEPIKNSLADIERQIRFNKFQLSNIEKSISEMLKVLNEEGKNVEK